MTLPFADDSKPVLSEDERRAAVLKLVMTIMPIEGVAILFVFIIPVAVLEWDPVMMAIPLVGVMIVTGIWFSMGLMKLGKS